MTKYLLALMLFLITLPSFARGEIEVRPNEIYHGTNLKTVTIESIISKLEAPQVVIISEIHDLKSHHEKQLEFLNELYKSNIASISVGMEFISFPFQDQVDSYLNNELDDEEFKKLIQWGNNDFLQYKPLIQFPMKSMGKTLAINAPSHLTKKIAKLGMENLNSEELALIPQGFELGNSLYLQRFKEVMTGGGHTLPDAVVKRYFEAQSVWDHTMAWYSKDYLEKNPEQILVIIVGDFHAQYGGGLPDRLHKLGVKKVTTISQVNLKDLSNEEQEELIIPDSRYGKRADYIWTSLE